jgi:hypothetical protein
MITCDNSKLLQSNTYISESMDMFFSKPENNPVSR